MIPPLFLTLTRISPYSIGQAAPTPSSTEPGPSPSMSQALIQVSATYAGKTNAAQRAQSWQPVIAILTQIKTPSTERADAKNYLAQFIQRSFGSIPKDIPSIINFLKTVSKQEAIMLLQVWIQTNTQAQVPNQRYYDPETYIKRGSGDCTEVAWLAEQVLRALDIRTDVFISWYRLDYSLEQQAAGHAFTRCSFIEDGLDQLVIFDNSQVRFVDPHTPWKQLVWETYGDIVWEYRAMDTSRWKSGDLDANDPQMNNKSAFTIYVPIPRNIALSAFAAIGPLSDFFDDPTAEILFFRDDFRQTILERKTQGALSNADYENLLALWRQYENDGTRMY